jgi:hypothetical protein
MKPGYGAASKYSRLDVIGNPKNSLLVNTHGSDSDCNDPCTFAS